MHLNGPIQRRGKWRFLKISKEMSERQNMARNIYLLFWVYWVNSPFLI